MDTTDERRVYELGYHVVPTLSEEDMLKEVDSLRSAIKDLQGDFIAEGEPTLIDLAYTMYINEGGKNTPFNKAYFGWIKFKLTPEQIEILKTDTIDENKNILRYLLIKTVEEDTRAQVNLEELKEVKNDEVLAPAPKVEEKQEESGEDKSAKDTEREIDETIEKLLEE